MKTFLVTCFFVYFGLFTIISASAETFQGINYIVIDKSAIGNLKCSIDIRLEKKVTKGFLKQLALELQASQPKIYDRLFIIYYLPGMKLGSGAWATSHFNPNLDVKILGTTIEEEKAMINKSKKSSGDILGEWFDESPYVAAKYTFIKKGTKLFMIRKYKDGSSLEEEVIQRNQSGKKRLDKKESNSFGEYYQIERNGDLGLYDSEGLIIKIQSVK